MTERNVNQRDRTRELFAQLADLEPADPAYRSGRDELVRLHLPLVRYVARRFSGRGEPDDDLVQIGTVGLLQAIDRFDPDRGLEFSTFATPNIAGEIKRHFRDRGWMVRVPRRLQELRAELAAGVHELSQRLGRSPTVAELARHLSISEDEVIEGTESARAYAAVSLDVPSGVTGMTIAETLADEDASIEHVELRQALRPVLASLGARERRVLLLRFVDNKTQSEIATALGISQVHVSRLLAKTLAELRTRLPDLHLDIRG
jgi:RNA polymerase sigma-B factor